MRLNILIGGKAGQGINKVSEILSNILISQGYFTFNYRDYPSLIRGGHNFNILSLSDHRVGSYESKLDGIVAMDANDPKFQERALFEAASQYQKSGYINRSALSLEQFAYDHPKCHLPDEPLYKPVAIRDSY